jgi:hypothetical protein
MALDGAVKRMPSAEATSPAPQILTSGSAAWQALQQALEETLRCTRIAAALHQDIEDDPVLVNGAPQEG